MLCLMMVPITGGYMYKHLKDLQDSGELDAMVSSVSHTLTTNANPMEDGEQQRGRTFNPMLHDLEPED